MLTLQIANLGNMGVMSCHAGDLCSLSILVISLNIQNASIISNICSHLTLKVLNF